MSSKQPSNACKVFSSKSRNRSSCTFAENPPKKKCPMRLYGKCFKIGFRTYLLDKKVRNEILSTRKDADDTSLLIVDKNFDYVVNMNLVEAVLGTFFSIEDLVLKQERLKQVLFITYTELCGIRDRIEVDDFFEKEMDRFEKAKIQKKSLISQKAEMFARFEQKKNSLIGHRKISMPISVRRATNSINHVIYEWKYPEKWRQFFQQRSMEIFYSAVFDSNSQNGVLLSKSCVKTFKGKQAGEGSSVSENRRNAEADIDMFLKPLQVPKTKQPGWKYQKTSDKSSDCRPTTMEVNADFINNTNKQKINTIESKQTNISQLLGSSISSAHTQSHLIPKPISLPGTSLESREQLGNRLFSSESSVFPSLKEYSVRTQSNDVISGRPTTMEVNTDFVMENKKKEEEETIETMQAKISQLLQLLRSSVSSAHTQTHLIPMPISVPGTSYESREQPEKRLFSSESSVFPSLKEYSVRTQSNGVISDAIFSPFVQPVTSQKKKTAPEPLVPGRIDEYVPINMNENGQLNEGISNSFEEPSTLLKKKTAEEPLVPGRIDEYVPINMNENGDVFDVCPDLLYNEMYSEDLLDFHDLQNHDPELIPFFCHSQPLGKQFLDIDGSDSS